jgi:hypothetical protein
MSFFKLDSSGVRAPANAARKPAAAKKGMAAKASSFQFAQASTGSRSADIDETKFSKF